MGNHVHLNHAPLHASARLYVYETLHLRHSYDTTGRISAVQCRVRIPNIHAMYKQSQQRRLMEGHPCEDE